MDSERTEAAHATISGAWIEVMFRADLKAPKEIAFSGKSARTVLDLISKEWESAMEIEAPHRLNSSFGFTVTSGETQYYFLTSNLKHDGKWRKMRDEKAMVSGIVEVVLEQRSITPSEVAIYSPYLPERFKPKWITRISC